MPPDEQITQPSTSSGVHEADPAQQGPTPGDEFASGGVTSAGDSPASVPAQPAGQPASAGTPGAGPEALLSVTDAIRQWGMADQLGEAMQRGDYGALQELANRAREAEGLRRQIQQQDFYSRLGQQIAPHAEKFQQYLGTQQPPAPARQPWEPPIDSATAERYMQFVDRDQNTGIYASKPGIDPQIAARVNEYQDWMQGFLRNPGQLITQAAQHVSEKTFDERFEAHYRELQSRQQVESILQENSPWLYQRNPDGAVARQNGQPMFTPEGAAYVRALQTLDQAGVKDPVQKNKLAISIVQGQIYEAQTAAQSRQAQAAPAQQQALAGTGPNVNPLQSLGAAERAQTPGATEPSTEGLDFRSATANAFKLAGITDSDFGPDMFGSG